MVAEYTNFVSLSLYFGKVFISPTCWGHRDSQGWNGGMMPVDHELELQAGKLAGGSAFESCHLAVADNNINIS